MTLFGWPVGAVGVALEDRQSDAARRCWAAGPPTDLRPARSAVGLDARVAGKAALDEVALGRPRPSRRAIADRAGGTRSGRGQTGASGSMVEEVVPVVADRLRREPPTSRAASRCRRSPAGAAGVIFVAGCWTSFLSWTKTPRSLCVHRRGLVEDRCADRGSRRSASGIATRSWRTPGLQPTGELGELGEERALRGAADPVPAEQPARPRRSPPGARRVGGDRREGDRGVA